MKPRPSGALLQSSRRSANRAVHTEKRKRRKAKSGRRGRSDGVSSPLRRDMEIARQIQTSILPKRMDVEGIEVSAGMVPAEDIGGDYYDILPVKAGCWIGIGDVAGHGLGAGLIMVMIQSMVMALVRANEDALPRDLVCILNRLLYDNIRGRLAQDDHVTFCLMRYRADGSVVFAGAHEEILVFRTDGRFEQIPTTGAWLGAVPDLNDVTKDSSVQLQPGDLMVLYSDGLIEARNGRGVQFGLPRLAALVEKHRDASPDQIRRRIFQRLRVWTAKQEDDVTVIVVRCQGVYWGG
jgi:sigma-B regulation protein RsbU (phosphoserine phosphatase)